MDVYESLATAVMAIKSDDELREAFIKILSVGSYTQQIRVEKIMSEISGMSPPDEVMQLLELLKNDKLANIVYKELTD